MPEQQFPAPAPEKDMSNAEDRTRPDLHPVPNLNQYVILEDEPRHANKLQVVTNKLRSYTQALEASKSNLGLGRPSVDEVYEMFEDDNYTPEQIGEYIEVALLAHTVENKVFESVGSPADSSNIAQTSLDSLVQAASTVREIYFAKETPQAQNLNKLLLTANEPLALEASLRFTRIMHRYDDVLDLLEPGNYALDDPTVRALLDKPQSVEAILKTLVLEHDTLWPDEMSSEECSVNRRDWADRYLKLVVGLPEDIRDDFQFSSYSRTTNTKTGLTDETVLAKTLHRVTDATDKVSLTDIRELHKNAGIVNFDYYTANQLKRMADMLFMDEKTIEHLRAGDVTVLFTDASGDYNGAFRNNAKEFDTESGRALFFEIHKPRDLYLYMNFLRNAGVKPSTLVLAAHGEDGQIAFNKDDTEFAFSASVDGKKQEYALTLSKALPRLISDFMQDSKGVDDNPEAVGRRRVIIDSCSQAKPVEILRPRLPIHSKPKFDEQLVWRMPGQAPLIRTTESTAEAVTRLANHPRLDVYAPGDVAALYPTGSGTGVRYARVYEPGDVDERHEPMTTSHFTMDKYGNLIKRELDEVILRRVKENA